MLTPRENFIRFFKNEPYERIPTNLDTKLFAPVFIPSNVARGLIAQQQPYTGPVGGKDLFGVDWVFDPAVGGSIEKKPLFDDPDDLENWEALIAFPDLNSWDWNGCVKENSEYLNTDKLLCTMLYTGFFERLISLVGFENAAVALIDDEQEDTIRALFDKLADFYIDLIEHMHRYFRIEWIELHDDWGTQNSTMFSAETYKSMIAPYIQKVVDGAHAIGVFYEQHSCGKIEILVPHLIDTGADTWRGQKLNDKKMLVDTYGDKFKFGVEIRPASPVEDEVAIQMTEQVLKDYEGKHVWIAVNRIFTPDQKQTIEKMIHNCKIPENYQM